nr:hypothetical protein [Bacteroidota bacterium]
MKKILITSVGSLVGQNILDALKSRRENISIIGINSIAESQRIFRCDKVYLVPPTEQSQTFEPAFDAIFQSEQPDLVLAGRDIDVIFLANYKKAHPEIGNRIPGGDTWIAQMMYDKVETFRFAEKNNLSFALTFLYRDSNDLQSLDGFIERQGFPLIVKPRKGCGSLDVFFVNDYDQVNTLISEGGEVLFQEYLCHDKLFEQYNENYRKAIPLFFQIPDTNDFAAQFVISPHGNLLDFITTQHSLIR